MFTFAVREPVCVGVKITVIVHVPPAGRFLGHVSVSEKSPGSFPLSMIRVITRFVEPTLVRAEDIGGLVCPTITLPKSKLVGLRTTSSPVPVKVTPKGLNPPVPVTINLASSAPPVVGEKTTDAVQLPPTARLDGQLFVTE